MLKEIFIMNRINYNTDLIEFVINGVSGGNNQTRIQLTDQQNLWDVFTYSLEAYNANDISISPQGNAVIPAANFQQAYLILYVNDSTIDPTTGKSLKGQGNYINNIPLSNLHTLQNASTDPFERAPFWMDAQNIVWGKSYLVLGSAIGNADNVSVLLNVNYLFNPLSLTNGR